MKLRALVVVAIFASLLSFAKFNQCENSGWATPDQYIHACYSDLPALYSSRGLDVNAWPFTSDENSVEYPVVTAMVMYVTSFAANSPASYFNINIFFLILLFIATVILVRKIRPDFAYLVPVAPAMIASLFINWDLWAIATMLLAIYWFDRKQYLPSALVMALSISTKFLPIFLIIPIAFILWRDDKFKELIKYVAVVATTWLLINLPFALTTPTGWWRFYKLNLERGPDWGSFWLALQQLGISLTNLNYLSILLLLIALTNKKDLHAFWLWQATELIYHVAIWQHIASVTGAKFGLSAIPFAILTLVRIGGTIYLMVVLARRALKGRNTRGKLLVLLFESSTVYP